MTAMHPLEKVPGATQLVTLPLLGVDVVIRRVDVAAVSLASMRDLMKDPELKAVLSAATPDEHMKLEATARVQQRLVRTALIRPKAAELLAQYGVDEDETSPDMGMGPDFTVLVEAIMQLNPGLTGTPEKPRKRAK